MPTLTNLLGRQQTRSTGPNPAMQEGFADWSWGPRSYAGPRVSEEEAVEFTAVYRALNIIAGTLGTLPIDVFDKRDKSPTAVTTPIAGLISESPNLEDTRFKFWSGLIADHVMTGNAFIHVVKNAEGTPLGLWRIASNRVEVGRLGAESGYLKVYRIDNRMPSVRVEFDFSRGGEIIHIMGRPDENDLVGFDPRRSLLRAVGLAKAADDMAGSTYDHNATPPAIISSDQDLTEDQVVAIQRRWQERHGRGGSNAGEVAVLGKGATFVPISVTPVEAELLGSRRFSITVFSQHFGIPPHLLSDVEASAPGRNLEEMNKMFQSFTLAYHYVPFEQAIDKHLFGGGNLFMRFAMGGLLRGTVKEQYESIRIATGGAPIMTQNEGRDYFDWPPLEGGDVLVMPLNMGNPGSVGGDDPGESAGDDAVKAAAALIASTKESRCPDCDRLLGHDVHGGVWCSRCKAEKVLA